MVTYSLAMKDKNLELENLKSVFVSLVSHELRTPVGLMDGFLELAYDELASGNLDLAKDLIKRAKNNSARLSRIVQELTDFSNVEKLKSPIEKSKIITVGESLDDVISIFDQHIKEKKITLINSVEIDDKALTFEEEPLIVIFRNILSNSVKFSPENSQIKIFSGRSFGPNQLRIKFRDYAIPIPKEKEDNIFNDFNQVENHLTRRYEGMGLGLAVAKKLSMFIGGDISLSTLKDGNLFSVMLPIDRKSEISELE